VIADARRGGRVDACAMGIDTHTEPLCHPRADRRCRSCGYAISAYADVPARCPMCSADEPWTAARTAVVPTFDDDEHPRGNGGAIRRSSLVQ
jgi:hypothetical protein